MSDHPLLRRMGKEPPQQEQKQEPVKETPYKSPFQRRAEANELPAKRLS